MDGHVSLARRTARFDTPSRFARAPSDRSRRLGVCLALILGACAHAPPAPVMHTEDAELARLRTELVQRDQLITHLEGRLALAEAGQRQLRAELERAYHREPEAPREGQRES